VDKRREQLISFGGVIALALALPIFLRGVNYLSRVMVGAEGRLAAIAVETDHPLGPLPQPWRALAQGGEELQTFLDSTSEQVKEINPKLIRIDHIYDGFNVVSGQSGQLIFNWAELDKLVDKISGTGAAPFFSLSYMPTVISKGDLTDEPKNYSDWSTVVQKTIEHYSGDKGLDGVYYEVWNEPDLFGKWTIGGKKDYKKLYAASSAGAVAARNVKPFKIGGPATTGLYKNWMDGFFPYVLENNLRLDFFSWHRYDTHIEKYIEDVASVDTWLDRHPYFSQVEKIVSEMGPSSDKEKVNSSSQGAAHLLAAAREFMSKISLAFSFSIKDAPGNPDGWGIIGNDDHTKPRYQALKLLSQLGTQRLAVTGEGSWVRAIGSQTPQGYQVLVVNYDPDAKHSETVPVTFIDLTPGQFILSQTTLDGTTTKQTVATDEALLQQIVPLTPNTAVLLELTPLSSP
jgi:hypothetical protein